MSFNKITWWILVLSLILNAIFGYMIYWFIEWPKIAQEYKDKKIEDILVNLEDHNTEETKTIEKSWSVLEETKLDSEIKEIKQLEPCKEYNEEDINSLIVENEMELSLKKVDDLLKVCILESFKNLEAVWNLNEFPIKGVDLKELKNKTELSDLYYLKSKIYFSKWDIPLSELNLNNSILINSSSISSKVINLRTLILETKESDLKSKDIIEQFKENMEREEKLKEDKEKKEQEEALIKMENEKMFNKKRATKEEIAKEYKVMQNTLKKQNNLKNKENLNNITDNYLLLGLHDLLSDTMIVASHNKMSNKITLFNIPRDTYVFWMRLNSVYPKYGPEVLTLYIEYVTGLKIKNYLAVDLSLFPELIDSLGGITIVNTQTIKDPKYPAWEGYGYEPYSITPGTYHMNGQEALKYARSRKSTSDFDRSARQQQVIKAAKDKVISNLTKFDVNFIQDYFKIILNRLDTNITTNEIFSLYSSLKNAEFVTGNVISRSNLLKDPENQKLRWVYYLIPRRGIDDYYDIHQYVYNLVKSN